MKKCWTGRLLLPVVVLSFAPVARGEEGLQPLRATIRARWTALSHLDGPGGPPSALRLASTPAW